MHMLQWDVALWGTQKNAEMWKRAGNSASKIQSCASLPGLLWEAPKQNEALACRQDHTAPRAQVMCTLTRCGQKEKSYVGIERMNKRVPHSACNAKTSHCNFGFAATLGLKVNFNFKKIWECHARTEEMSDLYTILISPETESQSTVSLSYLFLPAWKAESGIKMSTMTVTSICCATKDMGKE